jgi:hypothetical protein
MKTRQRRKRGSKRRGIKVKAKGYSRPAKAKPGYSEEIANLTLSYLRGHWER